jgi:hypothetical protein
MKKINLSQIFLLTILMLLSSCSNENDDTQFSIKTLLNQKENWTFDHYEFDNLVEDGNSNFTKENVENQIDSNTFQYGLTFIDDGLFVYKFIPNEGIKTGNFEFIDSNVIKINFFIDEEIEIYENINVTETTLTFEFENKIEIDGVIGRIYGKFIYK